MSGSIIRAYHGSSVQIRRFDIDKSFGVFWFSEDKDKILRGDSGAAATKYLMTCDLRVEKTAGWAEYDSLYLDQIEADGFDSIKLSDDWVLFDPKRIKVVRAVAVTPQMRSAASSAKRWPHAPDL